MTSHAAVVARGMGKCCVTACTSLRVDAAKKHGVVRRRRQGAQAQGGRRAHARRLDRRGVPRRGAARAAQLGGELGTLMEWVDELRTPQGAHQRRHADRRADRAQLRRRGHRPVPHRAHVLPARAHPRGARDDPRRRRGRPPRALAKILPMQRGDFVEMFRVMDGLPVTIRLLDPPLHEFLPHTQHEIEEVAARARQAGRARSREGRRADRGQPDARPPRLPARDHVSRDLRDPGRRRSARPRRSSRRQASTVPPEIMIPLVDGRARSSRGCARSSPQVDGRGARPARRSRTRSAR